MRLPAVDTYMLFLALKSHFTRDNYDFHKYHGKVKASRDSFLGRKDQYQFQKLSRICDSEEMLAYIVANLSESPDLWVGDLLKEEAMTRFRTFNKVHQSFTHTFEADLDKLLKVVDDPKDIFRVPEDGYPVIIDAMMSGDISMQTVAVMNDFIPFLKKFDEKVSDDILWPKLSSRIRKLRPFLTYNKGKIIEVLTQKLKTAA